MPEEHEVTGNSKKTIASEKPLGKRLLIAIPMAIVFIAIGATIYTPGAWLGGMMTDSCAGVYPMWEVWLIYLWPAVMLAGALFPPFLVIKNKPAKTVLLAMAAGLGASVLWYILWIPVYSILGC